MAVPAHPSDKALLPGVVLHSLCVHRHCVLATLLILGVSLLLNNTKSITCPFLFFLFCISCSAHYGLLWFLIQFVTAKMNFLS